MYPTSRSIYWRRGSFDECFECQLPAGLRTELLEEIPPPKTYRIREIPTYQPAPPPPPEVVFRPPPCSPARRPPVMLGAARPAQSVPSSGTGIWLLLGVLLGCPILLALLAQAVSTQVDGTQPQSRSVEVRRVLPPPVDVRRALPVVPRALPLTSAVPTVSNAWQPIRMPDGTVVQVCYQGELPSSSSPRPRTLYR
jgi:hypothetical protein